MTAPGTFAAAQALYAAHGIATFRLRENKCPAIKGYNRVGLRGSQELARKFTNANALGFMTNQRTRITGLDIDTTDENVLADALQRHGDTPVKVRTGSGKFHAWYRHNGERRRIRPFGDLPIDLLGRGGMIVAPPSHVKKGHYAFIEGSLDDLDRLPVMRGLGADMYARTAQPVPDLIVPDDFLPAEGSGCDSEVGDVPEGWRNSTLWTFCMRQAHTCRNVDALIAIASARNAECIPPLSDVEVAKIAASAWGYEQRWPKPLRTDRCGSDHFRGQQPDHRTGRTALAHVLEGEQWTGQRVHDRQRFGRARHATANEEGPRGRQEPPDRARLYPSNPSSIRRLERRPRPLPLENPENLRWPKLTTYPQLHAFPLSLFSPLLFSPSFPSFLFLPSPSFLSV
jgi:hypothetical protein